MAPKSSEMKELGSELDFVFYEKCFGWIFLPLELRERKARHARLALFGRLQLIFQWSKVLIWHATDRYFFYTKSSRTCTNPTRFREAKWDLTLDSPPRAPQNPPPPILAVHGLIISLWQTLWVTSNEDDIVFDKFRSDSHMTSEYVFLSLRQSVPNCVRCATRSTGSG